MAKLFIVPTPIGNLKDITLRALDVLKEVDVILAEDTRTSRKLLSHFEIKKKLVAHHQHNEHKTAETIVEAIKGGQTYALISDAGTPAISDPGFLLVRTCIANNVDVECLPGPTAFVPAIVNSGLPCNKFIFEGFLPQKKGRHTLLTNLQEEKRTMVFYESPHRLIKTLTQMTQYFGEQRKVSVARELTKLHEETVRGTLSELIEYYQTNTLKGEIVLVVEGKQD